MKGKKHMIVKRSLVLVLSLAMAAGLIPFSTKQAAAAKKEIDRKDNSIVYFVDAGDYVVNTVCSGDQFGTRNSVTDQMYGEDPGTGYTWGLVDTVSNPLRNGSRDIGGVFSDNTWPYESNTANADASSKTASNRYTRNQYENNIETRYIDYKFELDAGTYTVEAQSADPWNCSKYPKMILNSSDATADYKAGKGTQLSAGTAVKQSVTMASAGEMTVSFRAEGDDNKAINICYIKITDNNKAPVVIAPQPDVIGDAQLDAQDIFFTSTYLYENITLPTSGSHGSQITWETSDDTVLGADGVVSRPGPGEPDAVVQLTAKIYDGSQTLTKPYIFTVLAESEETDMEQFGLGDVEIIDDYYLAAQDTDIDFLKKFDNDRVLYRFRETAKLNTKGAQTYGGWENSYIAGHSVGHYLTAVAQAVNATGDEELDQKLKDIIHGLKECQDAIGTGFIFGAQIEDRNNIEKQELICKG